jgi:hypothetical protein
MLRRLLALLSWAQPTSDLSSRREPYFGPSNVIDLARERRRRTPITLIGFMSLTEQETRASKEAESRPCPTYLVQLVGPAGAQRRLRLVPPV